MSRSEFLSSLIGKPWAPEFTCWDLTRHIQSELFGRALPDVAVPDHPTWRWMIETIEQHPERTRWQEITQSHGLIAAADGALVLMARSAKPPHIGTWLVPERRIIHADQDMGVVMEAPSLLHVGGWRTLRFFEPLSGTSSCQAM